MNAFHVLAGAFLSASLRGGVMILLLLLVRRVVGRSIPARMLFVAWVLLGLALIVPVSVRVAWSPFGLAESAVTKSRSVATKMPGVGDGAAGPGAPLSFANEVAARPGPLPLRATPGAVFGWAWMGGVLVLACLRVAKIAVFWRSVARGRMLAESRLMRALTRVKSELSIRSEVPLVVSSGVSAPAVAGTWAPRILIPADFAGAVSDEELHWVLRHELGHWKRRDAWALGLLEWARIVHWFNPLVWLGVRAARLDCEHACDEFVMRRAPSAEACAYGAALLKVLGVVGGQGGSPAAVGIFENKRQLKRRIQMIAKYRTSTSWSVVAGSGLLAIVAVLALTRPARAADTPKPSTVGDTVTTSAPAGWQKNGERAEGYAVGLDRSQPHVKPVSAYIKSIVPDAPGFGGFMQSVSAEDYRGKRVRFSAWIKTESIERSANVWMRVDGLSGLGSRVLAFDNLQGRAPKGTTDWKNYAVVLDVPNEAEGIYFGFFIAGEGQAWFNDPKFEIVDQTVPTTKMPTRPAKRVPENLGFDQS